MPGLLTKPKTDELERDRVSTLLRSMLVGTMGVALLFASTYAVFSDARTEFMLGVAVAEVVWLTAYLALRRGRVTLAASVFFVSLWLLVTVFAALRGGPVAPAVITYVTLTIAVGVLWGLRVGLVSAVMSSLAVLGLHIAILFEVELVNPVPASPIEWWVGLTTNLIMAAVVIYVATSRLLAELWQTRSDAKELLDANRLLEERTAELETEIAERRRVEGELQLMGGAVSASLNGVAIADGSGSLVFVNDALVATLGYREPGELLGRHVRDFWLEADLDGGMPALLAKGSLAGSGVGWRKDGTRQEVQFSGSVVRDAQGEPELFYFSVVDSSDRRRAENLLAGLNRAARVMISASTHDEIYAVLSRELATLGIHCVIQLVDESGDYLRPSYLDLTPKVITAAERLTGLRTRDFKARIDAMPAFRRVLIDREPSFLPDIASDVATILPRPIAGLARQLCDLIGIRTAVFAPLVCEDRVVGLFSAHSRDLRPSDLPSIVAFSHQLSTAWHKVELLEELRTSLERLRDTQAQLVQSRKMDAIGRLAGGVAHDFNNQLTGIIGYADLLLDECDLSDQGRSDITEIKRTAERAATLTRQLLAFSRKQILEPETLDLNEVVERTCTMLRRVIGEHIQLSTHLAPKLASVTADPAQIEQVVMNLAINARDAVGASGTITLRTENLPAGDPRLEAFADADADAGAGACVMLTVTDDGAGIPAELREQLFEPFFTTKPGGRGTGLGLATVYGIVRQSRGWIDFDSEVGRGTSFRVFLPAEVGAVAEARVETTAAQPNGGQETILVAEDETNVRDLMVRVLARAGYTVLSAGSGREALELSAGREAEIDLLLTDVVMPGGIDGSELAAALRAKKRLPVLYVSGYTETGIVRDGVLAEDTDFLAKPFTRHELLARVRRAIDGRSAAAEAEAAPPRQVAAD